MKTVIKLPLTLGVSTLVGKYKHFLTSLHYFFKYILFMLKVWLFSVWSEEKYPFTSLVNPSTNVTEIYYKAIEHDTPFNSFVTVGLFLYPSNCQSQSFSLADLRRRKGGKCTLCLLLFDGSKNQDYFLQA